MLPPLHSILQQKPHLPRQFLGISGSVYKGSAVSRSTICLLKLSIFSCINSENHWKIHGTWWKKTYTDHWIMNGKWWRAYETIETWMKHDETHKKTSVNREKHVFCFRSVSVQKSRFNFNVFCDQKKCHWMKHMIIFCHWHEMSRYVFIMANISTVYGRVVWYRCPLTTSSPSKQV